jgi:hypothetical protein
MPNIALIDDRDGDRETAADRMRLQLEGSDWTIIDSGPLKEISEYPAWIAENDIATIVLDQRLQETGEVQYEGADLAEYLRQLYPELPIYILTTYSGDDAVQGMGDVEDVINRHDFARHPGAFLERIVRAGTKFVEKKRDELARLAELARRAAMGEVEDADIEQMMALQESMGLPFAREVVDRGEWLTRLEGAIVDLEALDRDLRRHMEGQQ